MKRVVVGLSGGVDSSVAAYLLQKEGYEVIGLFMKNWHDSSVTISTECPWLEDSNDAMLVAEKLGIPFQVIDYSEPYKERVVDYMFAEYKAGRTPNPDVLCNREIKFDVFMDTALSLGANFVATGHYARISSEIIHGKKYFQLLAGKDANKDQSYFLCQLSQEQLSKSLFPIGELNKSEVRKIAKELDLVTAEKKDSQGLCFVGKVHLPEFLQQKLMPKEGNIIRIDAESPLYKFQTNEHAPQSLVAISKKMVYTERDGKVVGRHLGAHYFTIGQRKGLAVGGTKEPLYVIGTDVIKNEVYVGEGKNHPGLYRNGLFIKENDIHFIRPDFQLKEGHTLRVLARIRYRQPLQEATLYKESNGLYILFDKPQSAITSGQFAAWYLTDELIGSGVID